MKKTVAEGIGAFFFTVAVGVTADPVSIGLILVVLTYFAAGISGSHFNPAVSLACWIEQKITLSELGVYLSGQFAGGLMGALFTFWLSSSAFIPEPAPSTQTFEFIAVELLFAFLFVLLFLTVAFPSKGRRSQAFGLIIGAAIAGCYLVTYAISGFGLNPAMNTGFAFTGVLLADGSFRDLPIYLLSAGTAGIAAAYTHRWFLQAD